MDQISDNMAHSVDSLVASKHLRTFRMVWHWRLEPRQCLTETVIREESVFTLFAMFPMASSVGNRALSKWCLDSFWESLVCPCHYSDCAISTFIMQNLFPRYNEIDPANAMNQVVYIIADCDRFRLRLPQRAVSSLHTQNVSLLLPRALQDAYYFSYTWMSYRPGRKVHDSFFSLGK